MPFQSLTFSVHDSIYGVYAMPNIFRVSKTFWHSCVTTRKERTHLNTTMLKYNHANFTDAPLGLSLAPCLFLVSPILYVTVIAIRRLYLSPLAKIPGPKLAALTQWYETYLEIVKSGGGQFLFEYQKWHEQYGNNPFHSTRIGDVAHSRGLLWACSDHSQVLLFGSVRVKSTSRILITTKTYIVSRTRSLSD